MSDVVDDAKAALEGVSDGPWSLEYDYCDCGDGMCGHGGYPYAIIGPNVEHTMERMSPEYRAQYGHQATEISALTDEDAQFLAASRSLVPQLVAEIERLRGAS